MPSKTVHRVDVRSAAVVFAAFGVASGVLGGLLAVSDPDVPVVFYPAVVVLAAVVGAFSGAVQAFLYNVVARHVGGLRIYIRDGSHGGTGDRTDESLLRCPNCRALEARDRDSCRFCGEPLSTG